jgi:hypothetical protein
VRPVWIRLYNRRTGAPRTHPASASTGMVSLRQDATAASRPAPHRCQRPTSGWPPSLADLQKGLLRSARARARRRSVHVCRACLGRHGVHGLRAPPRSGRPDVGQPGQPQIFTKVVHSLGSRSLSGGSGIRTHGGLHLTAFQELRICPLCHPSNRLMLGERRRLAGGPYDAC